eukprot:TRINITY_DN8153_c3_g1_i1.p2 TRINITY_DN8153_c3_g1~~TRINITY_DN8153_c3_g1_i1.p2  ORF type:complete len:173 (+),score=53.20 TRINITY_DN8153_c3_g1_i1:90-608(+)
MEQHRRERPVAADGELGPHRGGEGTSGVLLCLWRLLAPVRCIVSPFLAVAAALRRFFFGSAAPHSPPPTPRRQQRGLSAGADPRPAQEALAAAAPAAAGAAAASRDAEAEELLSYLRKHSQATKIMQQQVKLEPARLRKIVDVVHKTDPQLHALIARNPELFVSVLLGDVEL